MQSALRNFYRISNETYMDALAAKNVTDQIFFDSKTYLKGYVQEICMSPFGFLLFCQIQVLLISIKPKYKYFLK